METKKQLWTAGLVLLLVAGFTSGVFTIWDSLQNEEPSNIPRNYKFDLAINNVANARQPTQFDIFAGIVQDQNGNKFKLYESRTLVTNDFSKVFIGGRA
jgi:hypothetical protein